MKKIALLLLILYKSFSVQSAPFALGPWLGKLTVHNILQNNDFSKLINVSYPGQRFYQLKTLDQRPYGTCGLQSIKNVMFALFALSRNKRPAIKQALKHNFNRRKFEILKKLMNKYFGHPNVADNTLLVTQLGKFLADLANGAAQARYPQLRKILPNNSCLIASKSVTRDVTLYHVDAAKMIENGQFKNDQDIIKILNGIMGRRELLRNIINFKNSNKRVLGMPFNYPSLKNSNGTYIHHGICLIVHKIKNGKNYEFFALDSNNLSYKDSVVASKNGNVFGVMGWLQPLKFLKKLMYMPTERLNALMQQLSWDEWPK